MGDRPLGPLAVVPGGTVPVWLWAKPDEVEAEALAQLGRIAALPWVFHHVAAMPDVHLGKGATVGSVIAMVDAVAPSAVGVDLGCGVAATRTRLVDRDLPDDLGRVRAAIEAAVPVGFDAHPGPPRRGSPRWDGWAGLERRYRSLDPHVQGAKQYRRSACQMGTLGGGNHFIEVCLDTEGAVWVLLHSGSRGVGNQLAQVHMARARKLAHNADLPDPDLAVFLAGTPEMEDYRRDLYWAQEYARQNRLVMLDLIRESVEPVIGRPLGVSLTVHCHHNYVAEEHHFGEDVLLTRKGAIRAGKGELGIVPGSMGTPSFVVRGLGNPNAFESAPHGAGRAMSRNAARRRFTREDLVTAMRGIEARTDLGVVDEHPGAYKDVRKVVEQSRNLVEVVAELRQVAVVKG